jgi:hypothetical protein
VNTGFGLCALAAGGSLDTHVHSFEELFCILEGSAMRSNSRPAPAAWPPWASPIREYLRRAVVEGDKLCMAEDRGLHLGDRRLGQGISGRSGSNKPARSAGMTFQ